MSELKPCPFCGHTAHVMQLKTTVKEQYYIGCGNSVGNCIASEKYIFGKFYYSRNEAIAAWNRRAENKEALEDGEND